MFTSTRDPKRWWRGRGRAGSCRDAAFIPKPSSERRRSKSRIKDWPGKTDHQTSGELRRRRGRARDLFCRKGKVETESETLAGPSLPSPSSSLCPSFIAHRPTSTVKLAMYLFHLLDDVLWRSSRTSAPEARSVIYSCFKLPPSHLKALLLPRTSPFLKCRSL